MALQRPLRPSLFTLALVFVAGCPSSEQNGTAVGNPGVAAFALGAPSGLTVEDGMAAFSFGSVLPCADDDPVALEGAWEPMEFMDEIAFEIPQGIWCSLTLEGLEVWIEGALFEDEDEDESSYTLLVEVDSVTLNAPTIAGFAVAEDQPFVFEFGGPEWLSADDLGLELGGVVDVTPEDPEHEGIASAASSSSSIFGDSDENGEVSEEERLAEGAKASASNPTPEAAEGSDSNAPSCSAGGGASPSALLLLGGLVGLLRRRRVTPPEGRSGRAS